MATIRYSVPRILEFLKEEFGLTFDHIIQEDSLRVYLHQILSHDGLFRLKVFPHHQNFQAYKWIMENEILSDKSIFEILTYQPEQVWWPPFEGGEVERLQEVCLDRIKELNSQITYFQCEEDSGFKTQEIMQVKEGVEKAQGKV